ncbi:helix-turn-helix domain-containing protein [Actinomycetospora sp. NBRC 106375]|uniref:PucR family transcriptional regulator n=1 Tax=Actinomycetospora sp. NBRC 106375 TaxID=3032207 RepID=UPI002556C47C|nr:helix-turn-helix domain-containing protein [Actinomycetospora sp. NBRC 106375]
MDLARTDPATVVIRLLSTRHLTLRGRGLGDVPVERPAHCVDDAEWLAVVAPTVLAAAGEPRLAIGLATALLDGTDTARVPSAGRRVREALVAHLDGRTRHHVEEVIDPPPSVGPLADMIEAVTRDDARGFVVGADRLLGGPVVLLDSSGHVVAQSRPAEQHSYAGPPARTMIVADDGEVAGTLALPGAGWWSAGEETILRGLGRLLLQRRKLLDETRILRQRMALTSWLAPDHTPADPPLSLLFAGRSRLANCRPVVISLPDGIDEPSARALDERLRPACAAHPLLSTLTLVPAHGTLVGVYADEGTPEPQAQAEAWQDVLATVSVPGLTVSVGRQAEAGDELRSSYRASCAVAHLQRHGAVYLNLPTVAIGDDLGASAEVLTAVSAGQVPFFIERVLGDLVTDDRFGGALVETLYAYLVTRGSPQEAGRLLHLHVSSVKYRMRVIRQLLGARLDDPAERFDLELAARLFLSAREFANARREQR